MNVYELLVELAQAAKDGKGSHPVHVSILHSDKNRDFANSECVEAMKDRFLIMAKDH